MVYIFSHNSYPAYFLVLVHRLHFILIHFIIPGWDRIVPNLHVVMAFVAGEAAGGDSEFSIIARCLVVMTMIVLMMMVELVWVSTVGRLQERKCAY